MDGLNSSGTLISTIAFHVIGEFDSHLFIDHVETDWCFRAKAKGFKLYATTKTKLTHFMGDDICYYWFFRKNSMPYRSPSRHYYLARNSILAPEKKLYPCSLESLKHSETMFYLYLLRFLLRRQETPTPMHFPRHPRWYERHFRQSCPQHIETIKQKCVEAGH